MIRISLRSLRAPEWSHQFLQRRAPHFSFYLGLLVLSVIASGAMSCSRDTTTGVASRDPSQAYWALRLNQHAANMALVAPYDTLQLTATPLTLAGAPLHDASTVRFFANDSSVTVDSTGLVTAHFVTLGQPSQIIAQATVHDVTLADTVFLQVTADPLSPRLATFSMQPLVGDSAKRAIDDTLAITWPVTGTNVAGDTLCNRVECSLQVYYTSSNPHVAQINRISGQVAAYDTGTTVFTATTIVYGVTRRDSVRFTVGYKLLYYLDVTPTSQNNPRLRFGAPPALILGIGAVVYFWNETPSPFDLVFDHQNGVDTASATNLGNYILPTGRGNIAAFGGIQDTTSAVYLYGGHVRYYVDQDHSARRFTTAGLYRYHSSLVPSDTFTINIKAQP